MAYNEYSEYTDDTVGSWMLTLFVCGIPVIGVIYLLVLAFGSSATPSKRNFARAVFAWEIIALIATIILYVLFGAAIFAGLNSGH